MNSTKTIVLSLILFCVSSANAITEEDFVAGMEEGIRAQMLLYKRISPEVAAKIKPVSFTAEEKKVFSCVVSKAEDAGVMALVDEAAERTAKLNALIVEDTTISLATLEQRPDVMALMSAEAGIGTKAEKEAIETINVECGTIQLMMVKMQASGVAAALRPVNTD